MRHPRLRPLLFVLVLLTAVSAGPGPAQAQQPADDGQVDDGRVVDGIAAVVEDKIVLRSEVAGQVQAMLRQRPQLPRNKVWQQTLQQQIDEKVLAVHAERDTNVTVSAAQVQQALSQQIDRVVQRAGGEDQVKQIYGKSVNELQADFRDDLREQLLARSFRQRRLDRVRITPTEVRDWFEQLPADSLPTLPAAVKLEHIVRYPEPTESARRQAREIIAAIRDSARAGVPLEDLARRYSDDPGSAPQGGHITTSLGELVPAFAAVVSRAPIGEISQVFETPFGYHVARVNERTGNTVDFNHVLIEIDRSTASGDDARAFLSAVRDSVVDEGAPFALMARRHSEEESSSTNGGRVTDPRSGERTLRVDALGPSWKKTLSTLEEAEISEPAEVRLLDGQRAFHIVKLQERMPRHRLNLDEDYERIKELALRDKKQRVYREWITELRKDLYVDVRAEPGDLVTAR